MVDDITNVTAVVTPRPRIDLAFAAYVTQWVMCFAFTIFVTALVLLQSQKLEMVALETNKIAREQALRTGVIQEVHALRGELAALRMRSEERSIVVESSKGQVLANTLTIAKLEKLVDSLIKDMNEVKFVRRAPVAPEEAAPAP